MTAARIPAAKPGTISYTPVLLKSTSHSTSAAAPATMPAAAPENVKFRQKRLSTMTGPNDAPKMPHAFSTSDMIVPLPGFEAISSAAMAIASTTKRPTQSISLSVLCPLRSTGLYTSLANALEAASSCESAVLIAPARMALSRRPETSPSHGPEKILRTIVIKMVELSCPSPRKRCATIATITEKRRIKNVQPMPTFAAFFISLPERTDIKRMMICGMPK